MPLTPRRGPTRKRAATNAALSAGNELRTLASALGVLDEVLGLAVARQARTIGPATLLDPWRGMHLDHDDVQQLLTRPAHAPLCAKGIAEPLANAVRAVPRILAAAAMHDLNQVDLGVLLIVLAPDIDRKYERIYGYLQDDISRKRPAADLIANLLASEVEATARGVGAIGTTARRCGRAGMLALRGSDDTTWLARSPRSNEIWRNWLIGLDRPGTSTPHCAAPALPPAERIVPRR